MHHLLLSTSGDLPVADAFQLCIWHHPPQFKPYPPTSASEDRFCAVFGVSAITNHL